tara:strand:+ start:249 stop:416 length:168 start_codon:yes stop_codon:yes gene_type:complete
LRQKGIAVALCKKYLGFVCRRYLAKDKNNLIYKYGENWKKRRESLSFMTALNYPY